MGQKTHPVGLRLGLHRKWASSWLSNSSSSTIKNKISPYLLARGGVVQSGIESFIVNRIIRRPIPLTLKSNRKEDNFVSGGSSDSTLQTKIYTPHRFFPVSIQILKGTTGALFIAFFYIKLFGRDNNQLW